MNLVYVTPLSSGLRGLLMVPFPDSSDVPGSSQDHGTSGKASPGQKGMSAWKDAFAVKFGFGIGVVAIVCGTFVAWITGVFGEGVFVCLARRFPGEVEHMILCGLPHVSFLVLVQVVFATVTARMSGIQGEGKGKVTLRSVPMITSLASFSLRDRACRGEVGTGQTIRLHE